MIAHVTGGKTLPPEIADQIIDRTDGVPLFIEELTKSVVESGWMTDAGDHYSMTGPVVPLAIPTTLQASLLARLDRLAGTREVAQIAATLGRQFSHELISAVAEMPQPRLEGALEQLMRAELVFRRGGRRLMPRTPLSTRWCRTPPIAPCCAPDGSNCMAVSPPRWNASFRRLQRLSLSSWRNIVPWLASLKRQSSIGTRLGAWPSNVRRWPRPLRTLARRSS
jgi:hypothetical protein